jgi:hypothetical protein
VLLLAFFVPIDLIVLHLRNTAKTPKLLYFNQGVSFPNRGTAPKHLGIFHPLPTLVIDNAEIQRRRAKSDRVCNQLKAHLIAKQPQIKPTSAARNSPYIRVCVRAELQHLRPPPFFLAMLASQNKIYFRRAGSYPGFNVSCLSP